MDILFEKFQQKLALTELDFVRSIMYEINWKGRLIGIKGQRGVGKTTLLLQYVKKNLQKEINSALYANLDNIWFSENKLVDLADDFVKQGGKYLFLDEVHKYPNWSQELKNIYDDHPKLKVVFTGSSLLEILNARADLSGRAVVYNMQGLSFREYLNMQTGSRFESVALEDLLKNHLILSRKIVSKIKPLRYFSGYLKNGYYPFYKEEPDLYYLRLEEVVNMIIEIELPLLRGMDPAFINKIKQLLFVIAGAVPFIPNVSKISDRIGLNRNTLLTYLHYLQEIRLTNNLFKDAKGITKLQKPDKIFLENTNLIYVLNKQNANAGNLRETFFVNQVGYHHEIEFANEGDFIVDGKYTFEVGGKSKNNEQIKNIKNVFIAADNIEYGMANKIPLWLFGFLY